MNTVLGIVGVGLLFFAAIWTRRRAWSNAPITPWFVLALFGLALIGVLLIAMGLGPAAFVSR